MDPLFLAYLSLTFALVIAPGATTAVVVRNTLAGGWSAGLAAALGAAMGNATHAIAAGLGLAVVLARVPPLLMAVQVAGGLYLGWLGVASARRAWLGRSLPASAQILGPGDRREHHHAIREGITVNLLNPPIATFYLAVVPSFLPEDAAAGYYVTLAAIHIGMAFVCHAAWAFSLSRLRRLLTRPGAQVLLEAATAIVLLLLASRVLYDAVV